MYTQSICVNRGRLSNLYFFNCFRALILLLLRHFGFKNTLSLNRDIMHDVSFSLSQRGEVYDLRHAGLLHSLDLLCPGLPQHAGQVHGRRPDFCHPGFQLWHADLHLPAQVLRPPGQAWTQHGGDDEATDQTTRRHLDWHLGLSRHNCYWGPSYDGVLWDRRLVEHP